MVIPFNKAVSLGGEEIDHLKNVIETQVLAGDGAYTKLVHDWFGSKFPHSKVLMTPSCTAALEMAALLIDVRQGDEIIMPSFTFVSTANAFVLRGAKIVFVDVDPRTMNMNPSHIKNAITAKTKAIVPVHYGGISCDMDAIMDVANKHNIYVVEDAAQAMMSRYKGQEVGVKGHLATYSFHETKNYTSGGEGGLLIINDSEFFERAEVIREKGTNRSQFFRGQVDKYTWVDVGSSYLPGELQAAHLYAQLLRANDILQKRLQIWERYRKGLSSLEQAGHIELACIPEDCEGNGHLFFLKCISQTVRDTLLDYLRGQGISAVFHYIPLHTSPAGEKYGTFIGEDKYTSNDSSRLLRLPLFYNLEFSEVDFIVKKVQEFYQDNE